MNHVEETTKHQNHLFHDPYGASMSLTSLTDGTHAECCVFLPGSVGARNPREAPTERSAGALGVFGGCEKYLDMSRYEQSQTIHAPYGSAATVPQVRYVGSRQTQMYVKHLFIPSILGCSGNDKSMNC